MPLGNRSQDSFSSFGDMSGPNHLNNQRFRKVSQGANNNVSVEIVDDLRGFPANDARRTLLKNRLFKEEKEWYNPEPSTSWAGNGQGTSNWRSHQEAPREDQRPHRQLPSSSYNSDTSRYQKEDYRQRTQHPRRGGFERDVRRNYDRDQPGPSYHHQQKRPRY